MINPIYIDVKHQVYWLNYKYLLKHDISQGALKDWSTRDVCKRKYIDRIAYIDYDTIPEPSRAKLPSKEELKQEHKRLNNAESENLYFNCLNEAYDGVQVGYWRNQILANYPGLKNNNPKLLEFARRASVFEEAVRIYSCTLRRTSYTTDLFNAFNRIYPNDGYTHSSRFFMALAKAKKEDILSVAVDKRTLRKFEPRYIENYQMLAWGILSDKRAFDIVDCYDMFAEGCKYLKYDKTPSWGRYL